MPLWPQLYKPPKETWYQPQWRRETQEQKPPDLIDLGTIKQAPCKKQHDRDWLIPGIHQIVLWVGKAVQSPEKKEVHG